MPRRKCERSVWLRLVFLSYAENKEFSRSDPSFCYVTRALIKNKIWFPSRKSKTYWLSKPSHSFLFWWWWWCYRSGRRLAWHSKKIRSHSVVFAIKTSLLCVKSLTSRLSRERPTHSIIHRGIFITYVILIDLANSIYVNYLKTVSSRRTAAKLP